MSQPLPSLLIAEEQSRWPDYPYGVCFFFFLEVAWSSNSVPSCRFFSFVDERSLLFHTPTIKEEGVVVVMFICVTAVLL